MHRPKSYLYNNPSQIICKVIEIETSVPLPSLHRNAMI